MKFQKYMNKIEIKSKDKKANYSILIGNKILKFLPNRIKLLCPNTKKIGLIVDKNIPRSLKLELKKLLKNYQIIEINFNASEKNKNFYNVNKLTEMLLSSKFYRSDLILGVGGGIVGDVSAFVASILKRGINFINIPTTFLAQVDSSIGGKSGVNSKFGKNLIGTFKQPKLVISDVRFLKSLRKREMICGYAEVLKHAIIRDKKFFNWLEKYSKNILITRKTSELIYAIQKSSKIKLDIVNRDVHEKKLRMILNFGHTFAHAIETKNNYSKKINHGEAVLIGIILATKLSYNNKICSQSTLNQIIKIYDKNNLNYKLKKYFSNAECYKMLDYMQNDKKNIDDKINFILLEKIGKTSIPGKYKLAIKSVKSHFKKIIE